MASLQIFMHLASPKYSFQPIGADDGDRFVSPVALRHANTPAARLRVALSEAGDEVHFCRDNGPGTGNAGQVASRTVGTGGAPAWLLWI